MKFNKWTLGLAAVGLVSLTSAARADEKPSAIQTALSNTTISGYVSASANVGLTGNYGTSPAVNNGGTTPTGTINNRWAGFGVPFQPASKANGFNLDVVKLTISKPEDATPWAAGYTVDLLFGPDAANYNTSINALNQVNGNSPQHTSDYAIKQAFITLNTPIGNGIDWKFGVFDSPLGYEVYDAGSNPNYTHSYGYAIEPTELTGLEATYKVNDAISLNGGIADTSSAGINNRNNNENATRSDWNKAYFGDFTLTAPSSWGFLSGSSFFAGVLYGSAVSLGNTNSSAGYMGGNQVNYYGGLTLNTPIKELTTGVAFDYARNVNGGNNSNGAVGMAAPTVTTDFDVMALGLYTTYKATDKLSLSARGEYVEQDDYTTSKSFTGSGNLIELTGTVEYDLWANVQTRLEARWDQNLSKDKATGAYDFGSGERASVGLYANVIYKF